MQHFRGKDGKLGLESLFNFVCFYSSSSSFNFKKSIRFHFPQVLFSFLFHFCILKGIFNSNEKYWIFIKSKYLIEWKVGGWRIAEEKFLIRRLRSVEYEIDQEKKGEDHHHPQRHEHDAEAVALPVMQSIISRTDRPLILSLAHTCRHDSLDDR